MAYLSPGVYVQEVPSADRPIAGVGTSTAGFIGIVPDSLTIPGTKVTGENVGAGDTKKTVFNLANYPVVTDSASVSIKVAGAIAAGTLANDDTKNISTVTLTAAPAANAAVTVDYVVGVPFSPVAEGQVVLCTNFSQFTKSFGDFSEDPGQSHLAHSVFGFFNNGGTRCYVVREKAATTIDSSLTKFDALDEIAIVVAPGIGTGTTDADTAARAAIVTHCEVKTGDRFAILDSTETVTDFTVASISPPANSTYAAFYFPWIKVFDPASGQNIFVPPSGHIAGIYARVDASRGVHKAPANEVVFGALDLKYALSRAQQDGLNPSGINCIRQLNGNIRAWGARTIGGDANADFKYINVRRLFLFLRKSIDQGTQWVVFEPNSPPLWQKIKRNITAFLTNVWRDGALFGDTPAQAFYVKCDEETNPPEVRAIGQVVTEIGVAVVEPAEFVVFRISQWAGPGQ
jgi:phage tail sheath protein FI